MARKKHRERPARQRPSTPSPQEAPVPFTHRVLEGSMRRQVRQLAGEPETPLTQAQDLVDQAYTEPAPQRRVALARQALALCPDCADAYVLLAETGRHPRNETIALYEQGVAAGERALGPEAFQEHVGHFWGVLETRPYMRARLGLALTLWSACRHDEALAHLRDMLRLNPGDNQGIRYTLAGCLLFLDRDEEAAHLLEQYPDDASATWAYTKALLAFRKEGDTPEARSLLEAAKACNPHVTAYLLSRKVPPLEEPPYYSHGSEEEAVIYARGFLVSWKGTAGAVAWVRAHDEQILQRKATAPAYKGPLGFIKSWIKRHLPQESDVWQAEARLLHNPIRIAGDKVRPWLALVSSRTDDLVLGHTIFEEEPSAAGLWDTLVEAMQHPVVGPPHRPTEIQVRADERWSALRPHLEEVGIRLVGAEQLDHQDEVFAELRERLVGPVPPGLLDVPGMKPEQVAGFYAAAAHYFRQAPWKAVADSSAIRVECARFQGGPWYAVVMGQSGLTTGLALYEELETLLMMWRGESSDEDNARATVGVSVIFSEPVDLPLADLEAGQRYGWEVARPDAYPWVMHKDLGRSQRRPLAWEIELLEACLRAIPELVRRRRPEDRTVEEMTVPVSSGDLKLVLSWVSREA